MSLPGGVPVEPASRSSSLCSTSSDERPLERSSEEEEDYAGFGEGLRTLRDGMEDVPHSPTQHAPPALLHPGDSDASSTSSTAQSAPVAGRAGALAPAYPASALPADREAGSPEPLPSLHAVASRSATGGQAASEDDLRRAACLTRGLPSDASCALLHDRLQPLAATTYYTRHCQTARTV